MKFKKLSIEEQATDYLREKIINGEIKQSAKIVESALSKELDLSRGTVRMALNSLLHEGLVVQKPYSGWQVFSLDDNDLWEIYHLRIAIEGQAAYMAAEKATEDDKKELRLIFDDFCTLCELNPTDVRSISEADFKLHRKIVTISKSVRICKIYRQISNQLQAYINKTHIDYDLNLSGLSHKKIVDAICLGDKDTALIEAKANITPFTELCCNLQNGSK